MRVLLTGSRTWGDATAITWALDAIYWSNCIEPMVLVHGACPTGADAIADRWAVRASRVTVERHPADWERHGKRAGYIRNAEMVQLGADLCLAFIAGGSKGATHCAGLAEKAGIEVRRWTCRCG